MKRMLTKQGLLVVIFYRSSLDTNEESNKTGNVRIKVTLRRVLATICAVEEQYVLHILIVCW